MTTDQKPETQAPAPNPLPIVAWLASTTEGEYALALSRVGAIKRAGSNVDDIVPLTPHRMAVAAVAAADREWFGKLQAADAEIARLTAEMRRCGKDNCMGQRVEGVTQWCTLEARDAAVAEAVAKERARERERCAKLCEDISDEYQRTEGRNYPELKSDAETGADACAAAIRTAQERT